jgi:hypothetical protein
MDRTIILEDFDRCVLKISLSFEIDEILKILHELKEILPDRDGVKIEIYHEYENIDEVTKEVIEKAIELLEEEDESEKNIKIEISKKIENSTLSIYSLEKFTDILKSRKIENILFNFGDRYKEKGLVLHLLRDNYKFGSDKYIFINDRETGLSLLKNEINDYIISERDELCNINSKEKINFLPNEFHLNYRTEEYLEIEKIFDSLTFALSMIAISNYSRFSGNELEYSIIGYKDMRSKIELTNCFSDFSKINKIYDIFTWIYKEKDNILERMEISRNTITLYSLDDNILKVKDNILSSIKSSYGLYLKKNVDSYIKTLKELQELLKYLEDNFLDIQEKFSSKFKVNIGAIFTFFMTTVLFNTLSTGKIENIFTKDISVLTISLLLVSAVVFTYEIIELNRSKNRLEKSYKEKKNYFSFLLDENEIKSFFDDEKFLEENKKQLQKMRREHIILFIFTYIVVLIVLFILSTWFNGLLWKFINFFIKMNQQV